MLSVGDEIGVYRVERHLGSGDFAEAYAVVAEDGDPNTRFALKLNSSNDAKHAARSQIESRCLKLFDHPGIPSYVDSGEHDGKLFVVMGLAIGRSLRDILRANQQANETIGDLRCLLILRQLLEILAYLHSADRPSEYGKGWAHRDIKDANVIVSDSDSRVVLIDFGFCKEVGNDEKRDDDSFFRAGAPRYAPPSKHDFPTHARREHDVFAVGVLAYQMLTNRFPWSVSTEEARGELRTQMETVIPPPIVQLNNTVRPDVSSLIAKLIEPQDQYRISTADALDQVDQLIRTLSSSTQGARSGASIMSFPEDWRDPLYGDIRLTAFERQVIDSAEMQRLRRIKQLGFTNLVYAGAEHSRLSHSVGSVYRVEQVLRAMEDKHGVKFDLDTRLAARLLALIHDVTHICFGHTLEDEFGFFERHDENRARIERLILDSSSELSTLLAGSEVGRQVRAHFDDSATIHHRSDLTELVSGMVGVDLLDYIDRDAMFCGLDHRVDSAIFRQFDFTKRRSGDQNAQLVSLLHGKYGIRVDREFAIESVMTERYALFLKAYTHRAKAKASAVLGKAVGLALFDGKSPAITEKQIEWMSDDQLIVTLSEVRRQRCNDLARMLMRRQLPDAVYRAHLLREDERDLSFYRDRQAELTNDKKRFGLFPFTDRSGVERFLAGEADDLGEDEVFVYAARSAPGLKRTQSHWSVAGDHAPAAPSGDWFKRLQAKHLGLWELWVFVAPSAGPISRSRVARAAEERFGLTNEIDVPRREGRLF